MSLVVQCIGNALHTISIVVQCIGQCIGFKLLMISIIVNALELNCS